MVVVSPSVDAVAGEALSLLQQRLNDIDLMIFDFDGVVADSEVLSLQTLRATMARHGWSLSLDEVRARFLGTSLATIIAAMRDQLLEQFFPDAFAQDWQGALFAAFRADLTPVAGITAVLDCLDARALPYCIASSSTHERLSIALDAMGMAPRFEHVFSAQDVARGKPAPDLFLHAASRMDITPARCLVVEDSPLGVKGTVAAGMAAVGFVGGSHLTSLTAAHGNLLRTAGASHILPDHATLAQMLSTASPS